MMMMQQVQGSSTLKTCPSTAVMINDVHATHADAPAPDHVPEGQLVQPVAPKEEKVPLVHATHWVLLKTDDPARHKKGQLKLVPRPTKWVYGP
jgi:hypothetical protein